VELNVKQQCKNLLKNEFIRNKRKETGFPQIHGWVFQFDTGLIKNLNVSKAVLDKFEEEYLMRKNKK